MEASNKTNWLGLWIFSGAAMLILMGPVTVGQAQALAPKRFTCEQWRDYYYNASTGDFIDQTSTTRWGGSRGYAEGCHHAQEEAGMVCLANLNTCEEAAGGCR